MVISRSSRKRSAGSAPMFPVLPVRKFVLRVFMGESRYPAIPSIKILDLDFMCRRPLMSPSHMPGRPPRTRQL